MTYHLRESGGHRIVDPLTGVSLEYEILSEALCGAVAESRGFSVTVCYKGTHGEFQPIAVVRSLTS